MGQRKMDRARSDAGCVSRCFRIRRPVGSQKSEARRNGPVVVCQHGLEGAPDGCVPRRQPFLSRLCGKVMRTGLHYVRTAESVYLHRSISHAATKGTAAGQKSLFSIIVPQHQQIADWLQSQPFVDPDRIAFYGLSYGGKSQGCVSPPS